MRSTQSVRIWLNFAHDLSGRARMACSKVNGKPARGRRGGRAGQCYGRASANLSSERGLLRWRDSARFGLRSLRSSFDMERQN